MILYRVDILHLLARMKICPIAEPRNASVCARGRNDKLDSCASWKCTTTGRGRDSKAVEDCKEGEGKGGMAKRKEEQREKRDQLP
jgi:hypothetical protein